MYSVLYFAGVYDPLGSQKWSPWYDHMSSQLLNLKHPPPHITATLLLLNIIKQKLLFGLVALKTVLLPTSPLLLDRHTLRLGSLHPLHPSKKSRRGRGGRWSLRTSARTSWRERWGSIPPLPPYSALLIMAKWPLISCPIWCPLLSPPPVGTR